MDEFIKSLTGWPLLGGLIAKIVLDEWREWKRTRKDEQQWDAVRNITGSYNAHHERCVRAWDRSNRAMELNAMAALNPELKRQLLGICDEARKDSPDSSPECGERP